VGGGGGGWGVLAPRTADSENRIMSLCRDRPGGQKSGECGILPGITHLARSSDKQKNGYVDVRIRGVVTSLLFSLSTSFCICVKTAFKKTLVVTIDKYRPGSTPFAVIFVIVVTFIFSNMSMLRGGGHQQP
jgi:hypothetical protein